MKCPLSPQIGKCQFICIEKRITKILNNLQFNGNGIVFIFRWGFTPLSEAERFGHKQVADYIKLWIMREAEGSLDGGTLTAQGGQLLLQQLQEMAVNK